MAETKYGIIKATPSFPAIDLLIVPHKNEDLAVAVFGPNTYSKNIKEMHKTYSHSKELPEISFREPTTSESISAASYDIADTIEKILNPKSLQLGRIVKTSEGVFANPPKDAEGNPIINEKTLKNLLNKSEKLNGIYLCNNGFGFAPYETFTLEEQDCDTFAQSGLARLLEHTEGKNTQNLREIASPKFYKRGVYVFDFDKVEEPVLRVVSLDSYRYLGSSRLDVVGDDWNDDDYYGFAFGVFDAAEGSIPN